MTAKKKTQAQPPELRLLEPPAPPLEDEKQPDGSEMPERIYKPDDDQLAIEIGKALTGQYAFFHGEWKVLEGGCWNRRETSEARRFVRRQLRGWRERGVSVSQGRIKSITDMLEDDLHISDRAILEQANERKRYINLRNGLFNLETMELEPHRPGLYFTNRLDFDYDPDAQSSAWRKYLNSSLVFPDGTTDHSLVTLVQEALGYSLTARTDLKASFWLVGERDSGKSTMIAWLKMFMGALHGTIDLTQLGTNRFLLGSIVGKRVVSFTEAESNTLLPDALYKALVGGSDEIYADVKNREPIVFQPEAKIWWAMNGMPRISDRSGATARRIYIIPFNRTIPESKRIANLEARLYEERAGIFNELIQHYWRVIRNPGFSPCDQTDQRRKDYIAENDTEATFIEQCADVHPSYRVQGSLLYVSYRNWCETYGFKPKNANQVSSDWRRLGFQSKRSNGKVWEGLQLKKDSEKS